MANDVGDHMMLQIDPYSRATVRRFSYKLSLALLIPLAMRDSYLLSVSRCMELYAIWMAIAALLLKERFESESLNHWSEALWLAFGAAGFQLLYRASL